MLLVAACGSSASFGPSVSSAPPRGAVPSFNPRAMIGQPTAIATVPDPSGVFVSGQAMSGVGWRVLLATRHGWTPTVPPGVSLPGTFFDNNWLDVADTPASLVRLWGFLNVSDAPPVDLHREIVVALGFLTGAGPICGQVRLDGVTFDAAGRRVAVEVEDASSFDTLPPAPSGAVSACAAVGNPTVIVLALDRSPLPSSPFRLRLDEAPAPRSVETDVRLAPAPSGAGASPGVTERYADGLPRTLDSQPVLRGDAALAHARTTPDATPFLLGGWVTIVPGLPIACPAVLPSPGSEWLAPCGQPSFSDLAGNAAGDLVAAGELTFHFFDTSGLPSGPAILRVHVHDPRAAECGGQDTACGRAMVAEAVLWTGDAATAPHPLDLARVTSGLRTVVPGLALRAIGHDIPFSDCGGVLPAARDYAVAVIPPDVPSASLVEIAASAEALGRALPIGDGTVAALAAPPLATSGGQGGFQCRWLRVANVALLVRTSDPPRSTDASFMDRVVAALTTTGAAP